MRHLLALAVIGAMFISSAARAQDSLTADEFKAILARPHSEKLKLDGLKVLAAGRKFEAKVKTTPAEGDATTSEGLKVDEKWVDEVYVVTTVHLGGGDIHIIVTFDAKVGIYRKWVLLLDDRVVASVGVRDGKGRTISYSAAISIDGKQFHSINQETHTDKKTTWTEIVFVDGKLLSKQEGEATATE
jgi:hypothetical protein